MSKKKSIFSKKNIVIIICVGVLGVVGFNFINKPQTNEAVTNTYIRTTTLSKGSIEDVISSTGVISSTNTTAVSSSVNGVKISEVLVEVGDYVNEGDVLIRLEQDKLSEDIVELNDKIAEEKNSLQDAYDTALSKKDDAWGVVFAANGTEDIYISSKALYDAATNAISVAQASYDFALNEYNNALTNVGNAQNQLNEANASGDATTIANAQAIYDNASIIFTEKDNALNMQKANLETVKSTYNYSSLEMTYNSAKTNYDTTYSTYLSAENQLADAKENLETNSSQLLESYQDQLDTLLESVENYTLTAESNGTVTVANATVGSNTSTTMNLITVADTNNLQMEVQVDEADIHSIEIGQTVKILSDAIESEVNGIVISKSPVASVSGQGSTSSTFTVTIEIIDENTGLLIGMNAQANIMISAVEDVYMVPIDAIETEDGKTYVYKQVNDEQTEESFERIEVSTGESNDYYIEIYGSEVNEGLIIRSSANMEEALVETNLNFENMMPGGQIPLGGGQMPGGRN